MQSRVSRKIRNTVHPLPPRRVTCCKGGTETDWIMSCRNAGKSTRLKKGARQPKSRKPLRNRQSQNCLKDRRLPNMENRRGPLNRRIKRCSILQQLNFGDSSGQYTVDGNPAPVDLVNIWLFTRFYTCQVVVWDFWTINSTSISNYRWWFQIFFMFTPTWGNDSIWRAYFSTWVVQPPTS